MHELNIVTYVAKQVQKLAEENDLKEVASVTLQFGEVSGIVPDYLTDFWDWYRKKIPVMANAELKWEIVTAETWCDDCKKLYPTVKHGKTCPYCGSGNTWLDHGQEMNIKEIEAC